MISLVVKFALLMGVMIEVPQLLAGLEGGGQVVITANDMDLIKTVVFQYQQENGHYPQGPEFGELIRKSIGSAQNPDRDQWGTPFRLAGVPAAPYVLSCGPDMICGTEDDLKLYIERIPEGESSVNLSKTIQTGLLDKFLGGGKGDKP